MFVFWCTLATATSLASLRVDIVSICSHLDEEGKHTRNCRHQTYGHCRYIRIYRSFGLGEETL